MSNTFRRLREMGYALGAPAIRGEDGVVFVRVNEKFLYPVDAYSLAYGFKTFDEVCADYPKGENFPPSPYDQARFA
jgi:hypothetical protein